MKPTHEANTAPPLKILRAIIQALCYAYNIYEAAQIEIHGELPQTPVRALYIFMCILVPIGTTVIYAEYRTRVLPQKRHITVKNKRCMPHLKNASLQPAIIKSQACPQVSVGL